MNVSCTQCGGSVAVDPSTPFLICNFCGSALYLDKSRVVFHYVVSPTIGIEEASGKLRRWMAGNETVKDLDRLASIQHQELLYFPMWRFVVRESTGDREFSEPASSSSIADLRRLPLSGGNLKFFSPAEFREMPLKEPDVLLDSASQWLKNEKGASPEQIKETNLIHVPFYIFKYQFGGKEYQAVIDGTTGRVLASVFPAKAELPFLGVAALSGLILFVLGLLAPNIFWRFLLYVIALFPLAILSYTVVKKY
jgi:hypothetical protein